MGPASGIVLRKLGSAASGSYLFCGKCQFLDTVLFLLTVYSFATVLLVTVGYYPIKDTYTNKLKMTATDDVHSVETAATSSSVFPFLLMDRFLSTNFFVCIVIGIPLNVMTAAFIALSPRMH